MATATGHSVGLEILKKLGLKVDGCTRITLDVQGNEIVKLNVTYNTTERDVYGIVKIIEKYKLVEIEDGSE